MLSIPASLDPSQARPLEQHAVTLHDCDRPTNVARKAVRETLSARVHRLVDDMVLAVDELVVNAVQHTPGPLRLVVELYVHHALLKVCDPVADPKPVRAKTPSAMDESGRGLRLVEELAEYVFVQATEDGKAVVAVFLISTQEN